MDTLLTGLAIGESPRWHQSRLWFAHWGTQEIMAVDLDGKALVDDECAKKAVTELNRDRD